MLGIQYSLVKQRFVTVLEMLKNIPTTNVFRIDSRLDDFVVWV